MFVNTYTSICIIFQRFQVCLLSVLYYLLLLVALLSYSTIRINQCYYLYLFNLTSTTRTVVSSASLGIWRRSFIVRVIYLNSILFVWFSTNRKWTNIIVIKCDLSSYRSNHSFFVKSFKPQKKKKRPRASQNLDQTN